MPRMRGVPRFLCGKERSCRLSLGLVEALAAHAGLDDRGRSVPGMLPHRVRLVAHYAGALRIAGAAGKNVLVDIGIGAHRRLCRTTAVIVCLPGARLIGTGLAP